MTATERWVTASPAPVVDVATADDPDVSFVIVTYGTNHVVIDAIATAMRAAEHADVAAEVVVVDNPHPAEPDRAARWLRLDTRGVVVVSPETNLGFGGGCELGILHTTAPTICLLNPDIADESGEWLEPLIEAVEQPDVAIAAPVLVNPDGTVQEAGQRILPNGWAAADTAPAVDDGVFDVAFSSAACWVFTRAAHERFGGFDPRFHPAYFEDADLARRVQQLGGRTMVHGASRLVHVGGAGTPGGGDSSAQHSAFVARWPEVRWR